MLDIFSDLSYISDHGFLFKTWPKHLKQVLLFQVEDEHQLLVDGRAIQGAKSGNGELQPELAFETGH